MPTVETHTPLTDHHEFVQSAISLATKVDGHLRALQGLRMTVPTTEGVEKALERFTRALQRVDL